VDLPPPAAVICDLDGTLVDTVRTRIAAWSRAFTEFDLPSTEVHLASLIGSDGRWLAIQVAARAGRALTEAEAEVIDRRSGAIYEELNREPRPLPGAIGFLGALDARGIPWVIATSSRPEQVRASVAALNLGLEPAVVDGSTVARAKPEPDILLAAAARLGRDPTVCWCIGDSEWDMRAARSARMPAVGVASGAAQPGTLLDAGAWTVVDRLDALVDLLPPAARVRPRPSGRPAGN
jgi:HAD superfamily hydrolase (TIGR01509 family)